MKYKNVLYILITIAAMVLAGVLLFAGVSKLNKSVQTGQSNAQTQVVTGAQETEAIRETNTAQPSTSVQEEIRPITGVDAKYTVLLDADNNRIIAGSGYNQKIYPASMTKLMTLIVAVENISDTAITYKLTKEQLEPIIANEESVAGFKEGEVITYEDMLYGLILPSGSDAALAIANVVAGSEMAFVDMMNEKCEKLGLTGTHFVNNTGMPDDNHYSTPYEIALIMKYAMSNETCRRVLTTSRYTTSQNISLINTMNVFITGKEVPGVEIIAGKMGSTIEAGFCLVSYAVKDSRNYIAVNAAGSDEPQSAYDALKIYEEYL